MKVDNKVIFEKKKRLSAMKPNHKTFLAMKKNNEGLREETMTRRFSDMRANNKGILSYEG